MADLAQYGESEDVFVALIGDVVASRKIERRAEFQTRLATELETLSERLDDALVGRLALLRGDEVQGLFRDPEAAMDVVIGLADRLFPVRMVHGLGCGRLTTRPGSEITQLDGPCFHHAREALHAAAKDDQWLAARGFSPPVDRALTALFQLMRAIRGRWTDRQAELARAARGSRQKDVAERFGISPSVVSESLKAAAFTAVRKGEEAARDLLRTFGKSGEFPTESVLEPTPKTASPAFIGERG